MVILTELVVIIAFMSRFKLDKDLMDLADSISGKKAVIEAAGSFEREFRSVQNRLEAADKTIGGQMGAGVIMDRVGQKVPEGVRLTTLEVRGQEVTIKAVAVSDQVFGDFVARMTAERGWKGLDLSDILSEAGGEIKFTMKAKL